MHWCWLLRWNSKLCGDALHPRTVFRVRGSPRTTYSFTTTFLLTARFSVVNLPANRPRSLKEREIMNTEPKYPRANVLGLEIDAVNMDQAVDRIAHTLRVGRKGYVCLAGVHGV